MGPIVNVNWDMYQGETWTKCVQQWTSAGARNLTGAVCRMQLRASPKGSVIEQLSTATGEITVTTEFIKLELSAARTAAIAARRLEYDLEVVFGGRTYKRFKGTITLIPAVTRT